MKSQTVAAVETNQIGVPAGHARGTVSRMPRRSVRVPEPLAVMPVISMSPSSPEPMTAKCSTVGVVPFEMDGRSMVLLTSATMGSAKTPRGTIVPVEITRKSVDPREPVTLPAIS